MTHARVLGLLLLCLTFSVCSAQTPLRVGDLTVQPPALGRSDVVVEAGLRVAVGKDRQPVALTDPKLTATGGVSTVMLSTNRGLPVKLTLRPAGRCLVWDVSCTNTGTEPLWLEVGPQLKLKPAATCSVFDGWDDFDSPNKPVISEKLEGNMPLVCYSDSRATVAVGLEPSQLVSYLRHEYDPSVSPATLAAVTRLIVDPGKGESVSFVTVSAPGEWGKYEAFDAYYESFPTWFRPDPRVDCRASLGSAQYLAWPPSQWTPELTRRLYGAWDWCYAPFRRTGDIVGRPELWNYTSARPHDKLRALPREQYLAWRQKAFADGAVRCDVGMMFYIPSQIWCEEQLARERYADSLTTDPRIKTYFDTPWVTGPDNELRVFPYETSFGRQSYVDMAEVARELPISGFAFDTAGDNARYFGPVLPRLPHRGWDTQVGAYCGELVAIAKLMDYVHTLQRDGRTLAVVSNPMANGSYASCFHSDSAMLERSPWAYGRTEGDRLRWKMGQKTLVWWEGYELEDLIDPETIKADQLLTVYKGLADFTVLNSLRIGYIPPPNFTVGVGPLVKWLPAIVECVQTGWQPVPAARVPQPLWSSRYGKGLDTLLAIAHETGQPVTAEAAIENQRLGSATYLFSRYDGGEVTNRLERGETVIPLTVPVRTPVLLRAQLAVTPAGSVKQATVSSQMTFSGGTLTATLDGNGVVTLNPRVPDGMSLSTVEVDGKTTPCTLVAGQPQVKVKLAARTRVVCRFASEVFKLQDAQLLDFPFVRDRQPNCTVVIPTAASETTKHAAYRVQEYWHYWEARAVTPAAEVLLPIQEQPVAGKPSVRLVLGQPRRVSMQGQDLIISAPDDQQLLAVVFEVLRALDSKYWFPENLRGTTLHRRLGLDTTYVK